MVYGELIWDNIRYTFVYDVSGNSDATKDKTRIDHPYNQKVMLFKQLDNVYTFLEYATPLCGDKTISTQMMVYAKYLYSLSFMEAPNYDFLLSDV